MTAPSPRSVSRAASGRPEILFPLFAEVATLPGIGPRYAKLLEKLGVERVIDLLFHRPDRIIDRNYRPKIALAGHGRLATLRVHIDKHFAPGNPRYPYKVRVSDETGFLTLVFFRAEAAYLKRLLPEGEVRWISGTVEEFQGERQMAHPDFALTEAEFEKQPAVEPVYPLTAGLSNRVISKAVHAALTRVPDLPEWLDAEWRTHQGWPGFKAALEAIHAPANAADIDLKAPPLERLAFDELLASQLALGLMRARLHGARGRALIGDGHIRAKIVRALPFTLTEAQERSIKEIVEDLAAPKRMTRLLQGDVGAGKTVVALLAMAAAVEAGAQAALMAPTEILARQHEATIAPLAEKAGLRVAVLTGRDKGLARDAMLSEIAAGEIDIVVGTHAMLEEDVAFKDLALVVIDEQHRFGVHQRLTLASKGAHPTDLLVMTATPIPRTLTLALYGDMDVSKLDGKPPGRKPVKTVLVNQERLEEVIEHLKRALAKGARAYWVCPLVEESEVVDLANAEERFATLRDRFPGKVGIVHGRLSAREKHEVMEAFQAGVIRVLVATTVI
ncbi:MAG: ATP-dependent DNA helicase RecG, partial [Alphaproteobacteria bacterium]